MKTSALLLFPLVLLGATNNSDMNTVSALARKAPPEFAADAMIRLASNDKLDPRTRVKLLTEAFRRAAGAQHPIKIRASITRTGGTGGFLERAYQQELDALSLRLRAVQDLLPLDSAKGIKLFLSMARPEVPPVRCEEIVVYDVGRYYEALAAISKIAHRDTAKLLKSRVGGITSPAQIGPVAHLLAQSGLSDSDLRAFTVALAASLRQISGDDRSFTYYATPTGPAILELADELKRRNLSPLPLAEAYRLYLVNHLTGDRCADDHLINNGPLTLNLITGQPSEVLGWNASVFFTEKILVPPLKPFTEQEATPHSLEGFAAGAHPCQDAPCKNVNQLTRNLAFNEDDQPLLDSQRDTDAWRAKLKEALAALEAWQPAKGQADEAFREKTWEYNNLLAMSPPASRETVMRSWLGYLKQSHSSVTDRAQWFLPVNSLIGRVALDPTNTKLADLLRQQDDPIVTLYVQLERLAPRSAAQILQLL